MKIIKRDSALLTGLYLIAASIRLSINFSTEFIPGANGAFYLSNVRSIIESGELLFKDFPLIFYLEAMLAKLFIVFGLADIEKAIDLACRLFDSLIPPLSIIPAYLLTRRIIKPDENKLAVIIITSSSVLFISFLMLVSDFQKNSLGLFWLFGLMLFVHKSLSSKRNFDYFTALLFFLLAGLTHFGSFLVAVLYFIIVFLVKNIFGKKISIKPIIIAALLIIISYIIILLISPSRLNTTFDFIYNTFRNPVIILFLQKKPVISPIDLISMVLINLTAITALIYYIKRFEELNYINKVFFLSSIIASLALAFPFIGIEWAQRLNFMSYVPAVSILPFIFESIKHRKAKNRFLILIAAVIIFSILIRINIKTVSNINKEQYAELVFMEEKLPADGSVLIVARHGLEWWASYIMRRTVIREAALEKIYWDRFNYLLIIIQKKGKAPFGPIGLFGHPFREPLLPDNSELIYSGKYFDLFWSKTPPMDVSVFKKELQ
jgi:hypothetical protein